MRLLLLAAAVAGISLPASAQTATQPAQQEDTVFRSTVSLVRIDAEVTTATGAVVQGLTKSDFRIFDGGQERPVTEFSFEQEPLDLILLFDTGASMKKKLLGMVRATELGFHELKKGDRAAVMSFDTNAIEVMPFTTNLDKVNEAILLRVLNSRFQSKSLPPEATEDAARRFLKEEKSQRRRAVLEITDQVKARASDDLRIVRDFWQADAVLGVLVLGGNPSSEQINSGMSGITDRTGGQVLVAGDPGRTFQESIRGLRSRYTLYYAQPDAAPGAERRIDVQLSAATAARYPNAKVRARTGYIVPGR